LPDTLLCSDTLLQPLPLPGVTHPLHRLLWTFHLRAVPLRSHTLRVRTSANSTTNVQHTCPRNICGSIVIK
jgi:hypothetical protein